MRIDRTSRKTPLSWMTNAAKRCGSLWGSVVLSCGMLSAVAYAEGSTSAPNPATTEAGTSVNVSSPADAGSAGSEGEELSFDSAALDAPPVATQPTSSGIKHWFDLIHLSGRFDLNYELDNPVLHFAPTATDPETGMPVPPIDRGKLKNYHHFLFLKATPIERVTLEAELIDLAYYELKYALNDQVTLHAGKVLVPFGSSSFHHYYGARQGSPYIGLFVPNFWSEYGAVASYAVLRSGPISIDGDTYLIRGFDGQTGTVLPLNIGGSDTRFALGQRLRMGIGTRASVWASAMYNRWGLDNEGKVLLWGLDARLEYGLVPLPVLKDFALRAALARAEIRDPGLDPALNQDGWYWRYSDYVELAYGGLRPWTTLRLRYGTLIDYNQVVSVKDLHNWALAAQTPLGDHLSLLLEYQWNMEEVEEVDNDLFRAQLVLEF